MVDRIRVGVVGLRFGSQVHVPAFRSDSRCEVVAVAGRDAASAATVARELALPQSFASWRELVASPDIDAVGIAVPPALQPAIISEASRHGKHVFCEKPVAASVADARQALQHVTAAGVVHAVDFIFPEIAAWQQARTLLTQGTIGRPLHFLYSWRMETYASRTNAKTWKNDPTAGGGVLGNFVSHVFYNLEWLLGPIHSMNSFVCSSDGRAADGTLNLAGGVTGTVSVRTDAFLGSGHLIEICGDQGALVLHNRTADHASGFGLSVGTRASGALAPIVIGNQEMSASGIDARVAPTTRLVRRFVDAICAGGAMTPTLTNGLRVQELLAIAARLSEALDDVQS